VEERRQERAVVQRVEAQQRQMLRDVHPNLDLLRELRL
jgi:hypothetical protein